jgi:hypothetical protein
MTNKDAIFSLLPPLTVYLLLSVGGPIAGMVLKLSSSAKPVIFYSLILNNIW